MTQGPEGEQSPRATAVDYRLLFESAPDLFLILSPGFHIIAASDAYLQATMTRRGDVVGRHLFAVFPDNPNDPEATGVRNLTASLNRVIANRAPDRMATQKYDIQRPESAGGGFEERYWDPINVPVIDQKGELVYIIHRVEDVTEICRLKRQATQQQQLVHQLRQESEQNEQSFRLLVEGIKDYAIFILDPTGNVTSWNRGAERIHGYAADQILGQQFSLFYPPEDRASHLPARALEIALRDGKFEGEGYRIRQDGSQFWAEVVIAPLRDERGELTGFSKITRDGTERKRAEENARRLLQEEAARKAAEEHAEIILKQREQLQVTMQALNQAQKMEAVGQLAGGIAHDFNNLLTVILGYSKVLLATLKSADPTRQALGHISDAGERAAAALTRQLLAFSRQTLMETRIVSLNDVVQETDKLLRRLIGEDIALSAVLDPALHLVKVDPGQMGQVIMNLAINARDAMPKGGRLTMETRNVNLSQSYVQLHPESRLGSYVQLTVTDTGIGMTPEIKARVFEPFFTTKGVGKGTGLGLAVVHGIVKQSDGFVEVYSEPGVGTSFKIYIPTIEDIQPAQTEEKDEQALSGTETILLVEDEADVRTLACMVLESYGYHVLIAVDGLDALRLTAEDKRPIDLLLTDVVMPGMGGRDLADDLDLRFPNLKKIFSSGYTNDAVVRHGLSQDQIHFLEKPYDPFVLVAKVRQVLDEK